LYSCIIGLVVWLHGWGFDAPNIPFPWDPRVTLCHWTPQVYLPNVSVNGFSRLHECVSLTDDTDHAAEKCVAIGGIACAARVIRPVSDVACNEPTLYVTVVTVTTTFSKWNLHIFIGL